MASSAAGGMKERIMGDFVNSLSWSVIKLKFLASVLFLAGIGVTTVLLLHYFDTKSYHLTGTPFGEQPSPLAEALEWPWREFPQVTERELTAIREDLSLDASLMARDLRLWTSFPQSGRLAIPEQTTPDNELSDLVTTISALTEVTESNVETRYQVVVADLTSLLHKLTSKGLLAWYVLYNRGILYLWHDNAVNAYDDLQRALDLIEKSYATYKIKQLDVVFTEAQIATQYALAHAKFNITRYRRESFRSFRMPIAGLKVLRNSGIPPYDRVDSLLNDFLLPSIGLSSACIWNDLIAAYLQCPDFHDCGTTSPKELPFYNAETKNPCDELLLKASVGKKYTEVACLYRDQQLCRSYRRCTGDYEPIFIELLDDFYRKGRMEQEYLLWTLSNFVDLASEDKLLAGNPLLLFNSARMLMELGELSLARDHITTAYDKLNDASNLKQDVRLKIYRLYTLLNILTGTVSPDRLNPESLCGTDASHKTSRYREKFNTMYQEAQPPVVPFPNIADCVGLDENSHLSVDQVDRWLFIQRWHSLLAKGEFEQFHTEFFQLVIGKDVFMDFYIQWREDVLRRFTTRAYELIGKYEKTGDAQKANVILDFLLYSERIDQFIVKEVLGAKTSRVRFKRIAAGLITPFLVLCGSIFSFVWLRAQWLALQRTFLSFHHRERSKKKTKSVQNTLNRQRGDSSCDELLQQESSRLFVRDRRSRSVNPPRGRNTSPKNSWIDRDDDHQSDENETSESDEIQL